MTHLELENLVSEYLEGRLAPARNTQMAEHLVGCPSCRELVDDVQRAFELCRSAERLEPPPALVRNILLATVGERRPSLPERIAAFLQPVLQPRLAYGVAMAVFSFSIIVNAAGINLRHLRLEDLNPHTWIYQANRNGHLLYARAEKFYYDLRVVYEIESRLKQLRQQPEGSGQPGRDQQQEPNKHEPPAGGSTKSDPASGLNLATLWNMGAPWLRADGPVFLARSMTR